MLLLRAPGVYRAQRDSALLTDVMIAHRLADGQDVLDVGSGSGALAVAATRAGARSVTAVDISARSVALTWLNGRLHGADIAVRRGDLFGPVAGRRFGLVVANPPYVPSAGRRLPRHRAARCWDAGPDGRAVLDRLCAGAPGMLADGGRLLLVQSGLSGVERTREELAGRGLDTRVLARVAVPFGPVLRSRARMLVRWGLIAEGTDVEELVVVAAWHG